MAPTNASDENLAKERMTKERLEENRIFFEQDPTGTREQPPPHILSLRFALLDFACTLSARFSFETDEDVRDYDWEHAYKSLGIRKSEQEEVEVTLDGYREKRREAEALHSGRHRENEWGKYYCTNFTGPLEKEVEVSNKDSRRYVSR